MIFAQLDFKGLQKSSLWQVPIVLHTLSEMARISILQVKNSYQTNYGESKSQKHISNVISGNHDICSSGWRRVLVAII